MRRVAIFMGAGLVIMAAVWTVAASAILCKMANRMAAFVFPFDQWWQYAFSWFGANWFATACVIISGVVAAVPALAVGVIAVLVVRVWWRRPRRLAPPPGGGLRPIEGGVSDNHGHAQWRSMRDAMELFPGPDPRHGGIVVGEAYRVDQDSVAHIRFKPRDRGTWGRGGTAPLLIDPCNEGSGQSIVFAGTGEFKTTTAVSTVLHWTGSSVILDPSQELGPMLDSTLREQGKQVVHIGIPNDDETLPAVTGFNVLAWIDPASPEAEVHCRSVVSWAYDEGAANRGSKGEDPFFGAMGRELALCLLAHICWTAPAEDRTLVTLATAISIPEDDMLAVLRGIRVASRSPMARRIAGTLMRCQAEDTWSGIFLNCVRGLSWLFTGAYADMVSGGTLDPKTLLNGRTTVFLNIGLRTLEHSPAIARVLVGSLLNTVYEADGQTNGRILFLLDEAARLGRLQALETARDIGRKYGVSLHLLMQSTGQLAEIWGRDGMRAWIDAASWIGYASVRAGGAGKDLAEQIGTHGVLAYSEGDNKGTSKPWGIALGSRNKGTNVNVHEIKRSLMAAAELQTDMREDEIVIVPSSGFPIRCGRAIYFRRPEMIAQVSNNRFVAVAVE